MVISRLVAFLSLSALLLPLMNSDAHAQAEVPEPLQPWVDWTMVDVPNHGCSNLQGTLKCAWPGRLELDARPQGASFEMEVWLDRAGELALPGGRGSWPQEVSAGGRALVVTGESTPRVTLEAGAHTLRGRFIFSELPEVLPVPAHLGIIELTVNGQSVEHPRHDAEGRLWLKEGRSGTVTEADSLRATVYRRFDDGVPLRITTRLELNVAGRAREVALGQVLLEGSRAIALNAPLPVKVEPGGQLSVYVRPGTHFITIDAVIAHKPTADEDAPGGETLRVPPHQEGIFDEREVWAWFPDELVRSVELDGLSAVEPDRTTLPAEWHGTTTFLAAPGEALTLRETRRGQLDTSPNLLNLERQIWLDLDGEGATSRDSLTGTMYRGWRLDYGEAAELGRVAQRGTDLLITRDEEGQEGVEIRDASLDITADIRIEEGISRFDVVGWQHDLQHLSATLHTPPGWSVLGGRGVDAIAGSWLHSWDLLAFFFVLIVALSFAKLFGWPWGLAAAVALCLTHDMPEAPRWVWVHLLATAALLRALTSGRFRKAVVLYRAGALFILFITLAPFIHRQIQQAIAPQAYRQTYADSWLETAMTGAADASYSEYEEAPAAPQELAPEADLVMDKGASFTRSVPGDASQYRKARKSVMQIDPNAVVQTGPGVPSWSWQSWQLIWTGPVRAGHEVRLWLISPAQNVALTLVRLLLLIALALVIISRREMVWHGPDDDRDGPRDRNDGPSRFPGGGKKAATLGVLLALSVGLLPSAHAQDFPPQPMLDALKARQIAAASCQGPCVSVSQATIAIDDLDVVIRADVHAQQPAGWPLPGPDDPLRITEVRLNGQVTHQLRRSSEGLISVRLPEGVHRLEVRGRLMNRASLTLQFDPATRPHHTTFISEDWSADGIDRRGVVDGTLQLTRLADASAAPGQESEELLASRELEPWFEVQRHLALGVSWQMRTTIIRPRTDRPQPLRFPLLEGEAVITEGFRVEQGHVLLDFPRGEDSLSFESELPVQPSFVLRAATERPWTEIWTAECSAIWRCDYEGIAPIETVRDGLYQPRWLPWPGESLTVSVTRPEGSPGQATTVEKVHYQITPGERLLQASLELRIRSSRGDWQSITLPEGAEVQNVSRDDEATAIRPRDGALQLPVRPGAQTYRIEWQQPWEHRLIERFPAVDIGSAAVNVTQVMRTSDHRWLLWTLGPDWGPAVLFWSHLLMLLILATLLGLWKYSPLRRHEWVLLTLGLAPQPIFVLVPVVAFFMIFQWRRRSPLKSPWQFNLVQLALIALTLAAVVCLYGSIHENLLVNVDMQVQGMDSHNGNLRWHTDRIGSQLPAAGILSLPILVWRGLMLLWAIWLSWKLLKWAPWAWQAFSFKGIWKALPNRFAPVQDPADGVVQPPVRQNADGGPVDSSPPEDAADGEVAPPPEDDADEQVEPPKKPED